MKTAQKMNGTDGKKKKNRRARLLYIMTVTAIYGHKHTNTPVHEECDRGRGDQNAGRKFGPPA